MLKWSRWTFIRKFMSERCYQTGIHSLMTRLGVRVRVGSEYEYETATWDWVRRPSPVLVALSGRPARRLPRSQAYSCITQTFLSLRTRLMRASMGRDFRMSGNEAYRRHSRRQTDSIYICDIADNYSRMVVVCILCRSIKWRGWKERTTTRTVIVFVLSVCTLPSLFLGLTYILLLLVLLLLHV